MTDSSNGEQYSLSSTINLSHLVSSKAFRAFYDGGHYSLVNDVGGRRGSVGQVNPLKRPGNEARLEGS